MSNPLELKSVDIELGELKTAYEETNIRKARKHLKLFLGLFNKYADVFGGEETDPVKFIDALDDAQDALYDILGLDEGQRVVADNAPPADVLSAITKLQEVLLLPFAGLTKKLPDKER